jgi:hypothetical protein
MQFLKKNYEKILLGIVLLGLVVAVAFLPFLVGGEKQKLNDVENTIISTRVDPLPAPDLTRADELAKRSASLTGFDLSTSNKVFNPSRWQKNQNGTVFPNPIGHEVDKLKITRLTPLNLTLTLENVFVPASTELPVRYQISIIQEAAPVPSRRTKRTVSASVNEKKDIFTIRAVQGPTDNPTNVVLELTDASEPVSLSKSKPFQRVDGYMADMTYPPENKNFPARRVGDMITFAGETYKIIAIAQDGVVLSAQSNQKKWPIKYNPTP